MAWRRQYLYIYTPVFVTIHYSLLIIIYLTAQVGTYMNFHPPKRSMSTPLIIMQLGLLERLALTVMMSRIVPDGEAPAMRRHCLQSRQWCHDGALNVPPIGIFKIHTCEICFKPAKITQGARRLHPSVISWSPYALGTTPGWYSTSCWGTAGVCTRGSAWTRGRSYSRSQIYPFIYLDKAKISS